MKKLLFVCSKNKLRSPTAETAFSNYENIEAIGAGINADSETHISGDLIEWADIILVMEKIHKKKITNKYNKLLRNKEIMVLNIPDNYKYMQPELIKILKEKASKIIHL